MPMKYGTAYDLTLSLKISGRILEQIDEISEFRGITRSDMVRSTLLDIIDRYNKASVFRAWKTNQEKKEVIEKQDAEAEEQKDSDA